MLELRKIRRTYTDNRKESITALDEVSLSFADTGLVVINGTSGCGKTTLLNILGGLDKPTSGEVRLDDDRIDDKDEKWWDSFRATSLGFVYQDFNLLENMTVKQNIELPLELMNIAEEEGKHRIDEIVNKLRIAEYMNKKAGKLSGGQKQRVAIARAIVTDSKIILADEPTGNLDRENSENVFHLLKEIAKERLVIVVTHDSTLAADYADRLIKISYGKIVNDIVKSTNLVDKDSKSTEKVDSSVEEKTTSEKSLSKNVEKKLSIKKCLQFAGEAMRQRALRCFVSVMIFSVTMLLILVLCEFVYRNDSIPIANHIEEHNQKILPLYIEVPYEYSEITGEDKIFFGRKLYDMVCKCTDRSKIIQIGATYKIPIDEDKREYVTNVYICKENGKYFTYEGKLPKKSNEVAISKHLADNLKITNDQSITDILLEGRQYTVTAIVTKICGEDVEKLYAKDGYGNNLLEDNIVFFSTETLTQENEDSKVYMSGFGVTEFTNLLYQTTVYNDICSTDDIIELAAGRMPQKDNEILISDYILQTTGKKSDDYIGKQFKLIDIYEEPYGHAYWNMLNMCDYFGENITIVGIASGQGDYYITPSIYEKIFYEVNLYYEEAYYMLVDEAELEEDIYSLLDNDVRVNDLQLAKVYDFMKSIDSFKVIILVAAVVIAFLTILQMISLYSYSINDNKKTIGVLRTMGVNKSDTKKIFTVECIVITTISFIIAVTIGIFVKDVLNDFIDKNILNYDGFNFLQMRFAIVVIVAAASCLLSVISVLIPLKKYSKMKVIELIK